MLKRLALGLLAAWAAAGFLQEVNAAVAGWDGRGGSDRRPALALRGRASPRPLDRCRRRRARGDARPAAPSPSPRRDDPPGSRLGAGGGRPTCCRSDDVLQIERSRRRSSSPRYAIAFRHGDPRSPRRAGPPAAGRLAVPGEAALSPLTASALLAAAALPALLGLLGRRLAAWLAAPGDGALYRAALYVMGGAVLLHLVLTLLDFAGIPWIPLLLAAIGAAALRPRLTLPAARPAAARRRPTASAGGTGRPSSSSPPSRRSRSPAGSPSATSSSTGGSRGSGSRWRAASTTPTWRGAGTGCSTPTIRTSCPSSTPWPPCWRGRFDPPAMMLETGPRLRPHPRRRAGGAAPGRGRPLHPAGGPGADRAGARRLRDRLPDGRRGRLAARPGARRRGPAPAPAAGPRGGFPARRRSPPSPPPSKIEGRAARRLPASWCSAARRIAGERRIDGGTVAAWRGWGCRSARWSSPGSGGRSTTTCFLAGQRRGRLARPRPAGGGGGAGDPPRHRRLARLPGRGLPAAAAPPPPAGRGRSPRWPPCSSPSTLYVYLSAPMSDLRYFVLSNFARLGFQLVPASLVVALVVWRDGSGPGGPPVPSAAISAASRPRPPGCRGRRRRRPWRAPGRSRRCRH